MSETTHTPGPWSYTWFCKPDGQPIETVDDVAETIAGSARHSTRAELFGVTLDDANEDERGQATVVCYTGNGPNAHNNARLIAAAPDLLQALRDYMANGGPHPETTSCGHPFACICPQEAALKAIAKAEGR